MAILKKGLSGEAVRRLQTKLGVKADGEFGLDTEKALKEWQSKNGLAADGVAGPDTFMALGLHELVLLKQGTRGETVKKLQEKLAIGADGQFGSGTEKAVRDYQQKNGLVTDGIAGPATLAHMKLGLPQHLGHHQGPIHVRDGPRRPQSGTSSTSGEDADCARASEQQQQSVGPLTARITSRKRDGKEISLPS